jgi:hypothetical protein
VSDTVGTVVGLVALAAFGYFIYTRIQASKNKPKGTGTGGGGGSNNPPTHHK